MTMVPSGYPISLGGNATAGGNNESVDIELGQSYNTPISMNCSNAITLAGVTGNGKRINMSDFYGKYNLPT
jgi:hypothetical protein